MGLLDDAIREHLELKRRRGTDAGEIERLEREALGPVRRSPADALDAPLGDEPLPDEEAFTDEAFTDEEYAEAWPSEPPAPSITESGTEPQRPNEIEEWPPEHAPVDGGLPVEPDAAAPVPPAPLETSRPPLEPAQPAEVSPHGALPDESDFLEQETVEHDVEAEHAADETAEDDMLEETPEFLQDTPDHDRLWFEQRPPRDFDLDG